MKNLDVQLKQFKMLFFYAPNNQINKSLKENIKHWSKVPKSIEVLETLDYAVKYSLASDFAMNTLEVALKLSLENENKKLEDILPTAWWRN